MDNPIQEQAVLLQKIFSDYDAFLLRHRALWESQAFAETQWPWAESATEIAARLTPEIAALLNPVNPPIIDSSNNPEIPFWLENGIQGRKLAQIHGFIHHFKAHDAANVDTAEVIEWCAGKGHLGRILGFQLQRPILSLEWQESLCAQGEALAKKHQVEQKFEHTDVLQLPNKQLPAASSVIALHACGDLHRKLIEQAAPYGPHALYIAPCCYHLQATDQYMPLSNLGQSSKLSLTRSQLKLSVQAQVTGGNRIEKLRDIEQLWRLVFEIYRASISQQTSYQPLPSVAKHWFSGELLPFIKWACAEQSLPVPSLTLLEALIPEAESRLALVRNIDQVRQYFRRPLELWLLLDRALYLTEQGYHVKLQEFCSYEDSPRNTLIIAWRDRQSNN